MVEFKIGERRIIIRELDYILDLCRRAHGRICIDVPVGWKDIGKHICRIVHRSGIDSSKIVLEGRTCWGACDITLSMLYKYDVVLHVGHYLPPNVENVLRANVDSCKVDRSDNFIIMNVGIDGRNVIIFYCYIYYVPSRNDIENLNNLADSFRNINIGRVLCVPQYREYANYILDYTRSNSVEYLTGCYVPHIKRSDNVLVVAEGHFHMLTPVLYGHPVEMTFFFDVSRMFLYDCSHICKIFKRLLLTKIRTLIQIREMKEPSFCILLSEKLGQRREHLVAIADKLTEGYERYIVEVDDINVDVLFSYRNCVFINTTCPRVGFDDIDRFQSPIINPGEIDYVLGRRSLEEYSCADLVRYFGAAAGI
ncbi:MAG: hypothetical protein GXO10_02115 [Crenarchaeota archaeon]|nr:hypothetical protein [Thermoproteota archaeon]